MMQPHHKIYQEPLKNPWETFGHAFGYQLAMYTNSLRNQVPTLQKPMEMAPNSRLENTRETIQRSLKKPFVSKRFKSKVQLWGFRGGIRVRSRCSISTNKTQLFHYSDTSVNGKESKYSSQKSRQVGPQTTHPMFLITTCSTHCFESLSLLQDFVRGPNITYVQLLNKMKQK